MKATSKTILQVSPEGAGREMVLLLEVVWSWWQQRHLQVLACNMFTWNDCCKPRSSLCRSTIHQVRAWCPASQVSRCDELFVLYRWYVKPATFDGSLKLGLCMAGLSTLQDLPHFLFQGEHPIKWLIDKTYNNLVLITAAALFGYFTHIPQTKA